MTNEIWTIGRILQWTEQYFRDKGIDTPRLDGEVLLSHMLKKDRIYCYSHYDQPLTKEEIALYKQMLLARVAGKSVAAITGVKEFMALPFIVNEHVLIPRCDTETLVEGLLQLVHRQGHYRILDVCTGPGTILLSLLHYLPNSTGLGLDISEKSLEVAHKNREKFHLTDRAQLVKSNLFTALMDKEDFEESFDFIVSNPPYITTKDMESLPKEVKSEPSIALHGGEDGLDFYGPILEGALPFLKKGGYVIVEFGQGQDLSIKALSELHKDYEFVAFWKDLGGIVRNIVLRKKG